jgi:hypothetical protein
MVGAEKLRVQQATVTKKLLQAWRRRLKIEELHNPCGEKKVHPETQNTQ